VNPLVEIEEFLFGIRIGEGQHRDGMHDCLEFLRRRPADSLRRGIGSNQLRILILEIKKLLHELIILTIRNRRICKNIVPVVMFMDPDSE
jgi:hypothetical protein